MISSQGKSSLSFHFILIFQLLSQTLCYFMFAHVCNEIRKRAACLQCDKRCNWKLFHTRKQADWETKYVGNANNDAKFYV